jgi:hypothetical protein
MARVMHDGHAEAIMNQTPSKRELVWLWTTLTVAGCGQTAAVGGNANSGGGGSTGIVLTGGVPGQNGDDPSGTNPTVDANCGVQVQNLERLPGDVLLVLDTSSSMIEEKIRATGNTRWAEITAALDQVLPATNQDISWGLMQFPGKAGRCAAGEVDVSVAPGNVQAILEHYHANPPPERVNYTPTRISVAAAADWLVASPSGNPKYIVLATDGEPNCKGDTDGTVNDPKAIDAITDAAGRGVPVFVIGIATAGTAIRTLDKMAEAGGRPKSATSPKYYPAEGGADFVAAMNAISGQVASCVFKLASAPPVPGNVLVEFSDGSHAVRDTSRVNGWDYTAADYRTIELFGEACAKVMSKTVTDVKILFGCPDSPLIP